MNKIELVALIREMVQTELKKLVKPLIREMMKEEVRKEVDKLLTEMEAESTAPMLKEVQSHGVRLTDVVGKPVQKVTSPKQPNPNSPPQINFTKNPMLNAILTQTVVDIRDGRSAAIQADGRGIPGVYMEGMPSKASMLSGMTPGGPTLGDKLDSSGKSVGSMLPTEDVNGNPMHLNENALPEHVANALTRDYSKFMKKAGKKG